MVERPRNIGRVPGQAPVCRNIVLFHGQAVRMVMIRLFATLALAALLPVAALAGQWAEVGDKQLREDVELLHDVGILQGPVLSWPLPWGQIAEEVTQASTAADISPFLQAAARRIAARMHQRRSEGLTPDVEIKLQATNGEALVRDFSDNARSDFDASVRFEHGFENTTIVYGAGYQDNQTYQGTKFGSKLVFDNVYITQKVGNWLFYAGTIEQWWGPSGEQSLMLSNSARPYPKIGFKRIETDPFESKWLSWIGPWRFESSIGVQDGPRNDYQNPILFSQRIEVAPFKHFQMGLTRVNQLCGTTRPCGVSTFFKALLPVTGNVNTGIAETDFINSVASMDFRYARPIGNVVLGTYIQFFAEDSVFEAISSMAGLSIAGHNDGFGYWRFGAEAMDTYALRVFDTVDKGRTLGTTYLNSVYTDGTSYRGKPIGASLDGDSRLYSLFASVTTSKNWRFSGAVRYADINLFSVPGYRISNNREKIWISEIGLEVPTKYGDAAIQTRFQNDSPDTPGRKSSKAQIEAEWTIRF
jgi:Capsule assembly protein Wzi